MSPDRRRDAPSARSVLKLVYKIGMIAVTVTLATLAYLAYRSSTPGSGDVLMSIVLGLLALFALLSIPKLDWQDEQGDTYRGILDEMRTRLPLTVKFASGRESPSPSSRDTLTGFSESGAPVSVHFEEPEVHRVDVGMVDEARRMASEGVPIDDICRMIDRAHDSHDPMHQEAFRRLVQAMIADG